MAMARTETFQPLSHFPSVSSAVNQLWSVNLWYQLGSLHQDRESLSPPGGATACWCLQGRLLQMWFVYRSLAIHKSQKDISSRVTSCCLHAPKQTGSEQFEPAGWLKLFFQIFICSRSQELFFRAVYPIAFQMWLISLMFNEHGG